MQEKNRAERAKIFMPFAALKGFENALREKEKVIVSKRELSEEELEKLNQKMTLLEKGQMIKIIYFSNGEYIELQGLVARLDKVLGNITVVNTNINFKDILSLEII